MPSDPTDPAQGERLTPERCGNCGAEKDRIDGCCPICTPDTPQERWTINSGPSESGRRDLPTLVGPADLTGREVVPASTLAHVEQERDGWRTTAEQASGFLREANQEIEAAEARAERLEQAMGDVQHGLRRGHLADLEVVAAILASDPRERASGYDANPAEMGKAVEAMIADPQLQNPESPTAEQAGTEVESSRLGDRPEVDRLVRLAEFAEQNDAMVGIVRREGGGWRISVEWGREAPDSPMVGAASYGDGETLEEALAVVLDEIRA